MREVLNPLWSSSLQGGILPFPSLTGTQGPSGLFKQKLRIWKTAEFLGDCWGNHLLHDLPSLVNVWHVLFGSQDCEVSTGGNDEKGIGGGRKKDPMLFNIPVAPISLMREQIQGSICQITPARVNWWGQCRNNAQLWMWLVIEARSDEELMPLNCGVGEDSWESLGLQGDPSSPS